MKLTWRPLLDPMPIDALWLWLSLPLILVICIVYKAVRLHDLSLLWRQSAWLAVQVMAFFGLVAMGVWILAGLF